jgi:hypothetical protein
MVASMSELGDGYVEIVLEREDSGAEVVCTIRQVLT